MSSSLLLRRERMKEDPIQVAHVSTETSPYGVGRFLEDLACQQASTGAVKPFLVLNQAGPRIEIVQKSGVDAVVMNVTSARDIRLLFRLIKVFRECDVVNVHTHSPFAVLAAVLARKPIVFTFHGAVGIRPNLKGKLLKGYYRCCFLPLCKKITFASDMAIEMLATGVGAAPPQSSSVVFPYGSRLDNVKAATAREPMREQRGWGWLFCVWNRRKAGSRQTHRTIDLRLVLVAL